MKRLLAILMILGLLAVPAFAGQEVRIPPAKNIICVNNDKLFRTGRTHVYGVILDGASTGDKVDLYDNTSATGNPVLEMRIGANTSSVTSAFPNGVVFATGVYADVTDSETNVTLIYDY